MTQQTTLVELTKFAVRATAAERGMAVDHNGEVATLVNLTDEEIAHEQFSGFINVQAARKADETPFITNNMILDPDQAPNTNTNFANLRLVVVFLLEGAALYIDQPIRYGVIGQGILAQVQQLSAAWLAEGATLTVDEMMVQFEETRA